MKGRWLPRALVVFTALLCLGVGGYAGQAWWAKRLAREWAIPAYDPSELLLHFPWYGSVREQRKPRTPDVDPDDIQYGSALSLLWNWKECPIQGHWFGGAWRPRRFYYEQLKRLTGEGPPNDPEACEAWFREHPHLYWDTKRQQLVELR